MQLPPVFFSCLLHPQQNFSFLPELLELVVVPLIRGEQMDNDVAVVDDQPAITGKPFLPALSPMLLLHFLHDGVSQGVKHAVAGAGTEHKVVGKNIQLLEIQEHNVFTLLIF